MMSWKASQGQMRLCQFKVAVYTVIHPTLIRQAFPGHHSKWRKYVPIYRWLPETIQPPKGTSQVETRWLPAVVASRCTGTGHGEVCHLAAAVFSGECVGWERKDVINLTWQPEPMGNPFGQSRQVDGGSGFSRF